jgi:imidazolonepropionase-like amidohydrolase
MASLLIHDCTLIDCTGRDPRTHAWVRVEGERIAGIGGGAPPRVDGIIEIEAAGRVLMPGLIDAHAHLSIIGNITEHNRGSLPVRFLKIAREIEETLADGFTTVRDAGGLDWGLQGGDSTRPAGCWATESTSLRAFTRSPSWRNLRLGQHLRLDLQQTGHLPMLRKSGLFFLNRLDVANDLPRRTEE